MTTFDASDVLDSLRDYLDKNRFLVPQSRVERFDHGISDDNGEYYSVEAAHLDIMFYISESMYGSSNTENLCTIYIEQGTSNALLQSADKMLGTNGKEVFKKFELTDPRSFEDINATCDLLHNAMRASNMHKRIIFLEGQINDVQSMFRDIQSIIDTAKRIGNL